MKVTGNQLTVVLILLHCITVTLVSGQTNPLVASLDFNRYKNQIKTLASFGDRFRGSTSNLNAISYVEQELQSMGYSVTRKTFAAGGPNNINIWATKVGARRPDRMYIISAHIDGRGNGGAADDDGSGCALVLEAARAFAQSSVRTSVRFILWNYEESGLEGSGAYVAERRALQGQESPAGSRKYPEPSWLGIIQHDMLLFDHGNPPGPSQIPNADIDVEYGGSSRYARSSRRLAGRLRTGATSHSSNYPAQVGQNMCCTDSVSFAAYTAAVSVRENQRLSEIGTGANPNWHQPTDLFVTYSDDDFRLGFNALQMTVGTLAELVRATL